MAKIKTRQLKMIEALLESSSIAAACQKAGVPRRTVENWMRGDTAFQRAFREARERAFGLALGRLAKAAGEAVTTLISGMQGEDITHVQRLCARDILTFAAQARAEDLRDLADEVRDLLAEMEQAE